ncbi:signal peptide peptidase SppA [Malaciobacter marinus]|uniref:Signal peptide peptidase SppA n=1 Tax=Malaciobacter marinus TaxID=505249 RepID=A0A347TIG2_9BACT|nr:MULTISPECIES: signal peptide peptidase SppA [Malaciobacter]AXX86390.1 signal peptide peptidase protease IV [Malaciobacter marinus]PHO11853.1 signal peptide peptidase SppA [Malaciobacter marinus]PHO16365.1 signal peptide peptidase SppA [Malaciobacter marinus]RYA22818.1 signal peptide peptidase SppA [Malaciobacter halophilus]
MRDFFRFMFSPIIAILDFLTKYFKTIVFLTIMYFIVFDANDSTMNNMQTANLQKIELSGPIMDSTKVLEQVNQAKEDNNIKGVLFVVNSPGGAVAPSVEIAYAIKELKELKPVVAYASGVMASGSYYASIWANKIIANPGSMVGSIGVIFQGANVEELMQKIGVKTQTVKIGKYKEAGTPTRAWENFEKAELEKVIDDTYDMFITDVSSARGLKKANHKEFADAHIFTARQAKAVKLVDEVATLSFAQDELIKISKVSTPIWKKQDKFDKFIDKVINQAVTNFSIRFMDGLKAY